MKKFAFLYRGGAIPKDQMEKANKDWYAWAKTFKHDEGFRPMGTGKTVSSDSVKNYTGDVKGYNIAEADSLDAAVEIAKNCPILSWGGTVEVLDEWKM